MLSLPVRRGAVRLPARLGRHHLHNPSSPPHAYLQPLIASLPASETSEELESVMSLIMDRKETRNALSGRMVAELREGIAKVSADRSARVLLLHTPHPNVFCSGADLRERLTMSPSAVSSFLTSLRSMLAELEALSIPTIAVIDGPGLGGGCELSLGCDLRIGGSGAILALPEAKLGIVPGAGGTQRMAKLIGGARTKELVYTGRRIGGEEAERMGILNFLARSPETAFSQALLTCRQIVTSAPLSLAVAKKAIDAAPYLPLEEGLTLERELYDSLLGTEDRMEGLKAFKDKRRAKFLGR